MGWQIESTETIRVEDTDPAVWARAAESLLSQGNIDQSIWNIDKALVHSNSSIHYRFEKVKILCAAQRFVSCIQLLKENLNNFRTEFTEERKRNQLKEVLNSVAWYLVSTVVSPYENKHYVACKQQAEYVLEQYSEFFEWNNYRSKIVDYWRYACDVILEQMYERNEYSQCVASISEILTTHKHLTSYFQRSRFTKLKAKSYFMMKLYFQSIKTYTSRFQFKLGILATLVCIIGLGGVMFWIKMSLEFENIGLSAMSNSVHENETTLVVAESTSLPQLRSVGKNSKMIIKCETRTPELLEVENSLRLIATNFIRYMNGHQPLCSVKGVKAGAAKVGIRADGLLLGSFTISVIPQGKNVSNNRVQSSPKVLPVVAPTAPVGPPSAKSSDLSKEKLPTPKSIIIGNEVIVHSKHEMDSSEIGFMNQGDKVDVLEKWTNRKSNKGVLSRSDLFVEYKGQKIELHEGQAVNILKENRDNYRVQIKLAGQWVEINASKDHVRKLYNEEWFKIRIQEEKVGWVLGKFVKEQ